MATTPVFLPGKSHEQRSLVNYSPQGHKELDTTEQLNLDVLKQLSCLTGTKGCIAMHWSSQTSSFNNTREDSTHGHHQMVNTEIRLIIFFAAKGGEALYSQQKQDQELTVAQIMNYLLPNLDLN